MPWLSRIRSASLRATIAAAGGAVTLALAALAPQFFARAEPDAPPRVGAATLAGTVSAMGALVEGTSGFGAADTRGADAGPGLDASRDSSDAGPSRPAVWRLAQLAADPDVAVVDVPIQHKPLL
ncbi:MAG TPA: hypothetical protein VH044_17740, partial [Polyangiaceae bacterium]|nr:hypothetical protein [Polyangiaceae bacterium]